MFKGTCFNLCFKLTCSQAMLNSVEKFKKASSELSRVKQAINQLLVEKIFLSLTFYVVSQLLSN